MEANEYQVAGDHYRSTYQHWDLVHRARLDYYEGNATKYVARARKKNGLDDLMKARHYVQKRVEIERGRSLPRRLLGLLWRLWRRSWHRVEVFEFVHLNDLELMEVHVVLEICLWVRVDSLERVVEDIKELAD